MLSINYIKELVLDHFNYNDGISVCCEGAIAYNKMMEVMRVRCDIVQGKIGWVS